MRHLRSISKCGSCHCRRSHQSVSFVFFGVTFCSSLFYLWIFVLIWFKFFVCVLPSYYLSEQLIMYGLHMDDWQLWVTCLVTWLCYHTLAVVLSEELAALGINRVSYGWDLHFLRRLKEIGKVEMEGGGNYHLSGTAWSFCWATTNIQYIYHAFHAAQNSLLRNELEGLQELFSELFTEKSVSMFLFLH